MTNAYIIQPIIHFTHHCSMLTQHLYASMLIDPIKFMEYGVARKPIHKLVVLVAQHACSYLLRVSFALLTVNEMAGELI